MRGFVLYADCEVAYDGRAYSTLDRGRYLIMHKPDGCLSIHGGQHNKPLNYQNEGSDVALIRDDPQFTALWEEHFPDSPRLQLIITATRRKEIIAVAVHKLINRVMLDDWSVNKIKIRYTERELTAYIVANIGQYIRRKLVEIQTERPTPYGPIDIYGRDRRGHIHIIEVKRRKAFVSACGQLARYAQCFDGRTVHQYIACPAISAPALAYCEKHGQRWLKVDFDRTGVAP